MSYGERSCKKYPNCKRALTVPSFDPFSCNIHCPEYASNGKPPDSGPAVSPQAATKRAPPRWRQARMNRRVGK